MLIDRFFVSSILKLKSFFFSHYNLILEILLKICTLFSFVNQPFLDIKSFNFLFTKKKSSESKTKHSFPSNTEAWLRSSTQIAIEKKTKKKENSQEILFCNLSRMATTVFYVSSEMNNFPSGQPENSSSSQILNKL